MDDMSSPWDMDDDEEDVEQPTAAPAKTKKKKPQDDETTAAYGGNALWYQTAKPTAPKAIAPATPTSRTTAQGQRAAPASTPSLSVSPVASPWGGTSAPSAPKTRGLITNVGTKIVQGGQQAGGKIAEGAKQVGGQIAGAVPQTPEEWADTTRPSIATTGVPELVHDTATTGTPPKPPKISEKTGVDAPIEIDEVEQVVSDPVGAMPGTAKGVVEGVGTGRTPYMPDAAIPSVAGNIPNISGELAKIIEMLGGMGGLDNPLGQLDPNNAYDPLGTMDKLGLEGMNPGDIDWSSIPGANALSSVTDIIKNPGQWFEDIGHKAMGALGFEDLGAEEYMKDVLKSSEAQLGSTFGVNQKMNVADADLLAMMRNQIGGYQNARDAAMMPYFGQLGSLTGRAENDYGNVQSQYDSLIGRAEGDYGGLAGQYDSLAGRAESDYGDMTSRLGTIDRSMAENQVLGSRQMNDMYDAFNRLSGSADQAAGRSGMFGGQAVDWNDPNNQIAAANRSLYDQRAAGTRRAGLADAGVLSALGAQANANAFGGEPMTGGQLQAAAGAAQNRAGQAYATAQQRAQDLADQGLARGYEQTGVAYQRNQDALNRQRQAQLDVSGQALSNIGQRRLMDQDLGTAAANRQAMLKGGRGELADIYGGRQKALSGARDELGDLYGGRQTALKGARDELGSLYGQTADLRTGMAREDYDLGSGYSGLTHDLAGAQNVRDLSAWDQFFGTQNEALAGLAGLKDSERTGRLDFFKNLMTHSIDAAPEFLKGAGEVVPF